MDTRAARGRRERSRHGSMCVRPWVSQSLRDMGHTIGRTLVGAHSCTSSITVCKPTARRASDRTIPIAEAHVTAVGFTPSGTVVAEDVRDLQGCTSHAGGASRRRLGCPPPLAALARQQVEWALDGRDHACGNTRIEDLHFQAVDHARHTNENPPRISPGGPQVVSAIAATVTSAVSSFVASDAAYIGCNCEDSMTGRRCERSARPAVHFLDIAH